MDLTRRTLSCSTAHVPAAPASLSASEIVACAIRATHTTCTNADVAATTRKLATYEAASVSVDALGALRLLAWTQRLCCHGELNAIVVATLASRRRARIATAGTALAAHEVGTPLVHAACAAWGGAQVATTRRSRPAEEFAALAVGALDRVLSAGAANRDWVLVVAVEAIATFALSGRASIATARVSGCARKVISERVFAAGATLCHANVSTTFARAARELDAVRVLANRTRSRAPVSARFYGQQRILLVRTLAILALSAHHSEERQDPSCFQD